MRGCPPDLLDRGQFPVGEEILVEAGNPARFGPHPADGDIGGARRRIDGEGEAPVTRQGVGAAAIRSSEFNAAHIGGKVGDIAFKSDARDPGGTLVVVLNEEGTAVRGPVEVAHVTIEVTDAAGAAAVPVHDVQAGNLVALKTVVVARVCDPGTVGRYGRAAVGAEAVGQLTQSPCLDRYLEDFAVADVEIGIVPVGAEDDRAGVGRPGQSAAVVVRTARQLARSAAIRGKNEDMRVSVRKVSAPVRPVAELRDHPRRRRPLGVLGRGRHFREGGRRFRHETSSSRSSSRRVTRRCFRATRSHWSVPPSGRCPSSARTAGLYRRPRPDTVGGCRSGDQRGELTEPLPSVTAR